MIGFIILIVGIVLNIYSLVEVFQVLYTGFTLPFFINPFLALGIFILSFIAGRLEMKLTRHKKLAARVARASWILIVGIPVLFIIIDSTLSRTALVGMD